MNDVYFCANILKTLLRPDNFERTFCLNDRIFVHNFLEIRARMFQMFPVR